MQKNASATFVLMAMCAIGMSMPQGLARASATASILGLYPAAEVPAGVPVSFTIGTSGFTNPSYSLVDSFPGGVISKNIDSSGNFSWTPNKDDVGTHGLTITVSDAEGDSASVSEQIVVDAAASIAIKSLAPGTVVSIGTPVSFSTTVSGLFSPTYTVADSFFNSSIQSYAINASGGFTWTPIIQDIGTHSIVVTAKDSFGNTATVSTEISVLLPPTVEIAGLAPGTSVDAGQTLTFVATSSGIIQPTYATKDSFSGISTSTITIDASGKASWTPQYNDIGMHPISVTASDSTGRSATTSLLIKVSQPSAPIVVSAPTPAPSTPTVPTASIANTPVFTTNNTPAPAASPKAKTPTKKPQATATTAVQNIATVNTPAQTPPFTVIVSSGPTTTEPATSSTDANVVIPTTPPVKSIGGFILNSVINFFGSIFKLF